MCVATRRKRISSDTKLRTDDTIRSEGGGRLNEPLPADNCRAGSCGADARGRRRRHLSPLALHSYTTPAPSTKRRSQSSNEYLSQYNAVTRGAPTLERQPDHGSSSDFTRDQILKDNWSTPLVSASGARRACRRRRSSPLITNYDTAHFLGYFNDLNRANVLRDAHDEHL